MSNAIVTGELVEEPNTKLIHWLKYLSAVYLAQAVYTFIQYSHHVHVNTYQWVLLAVSTFIYVAWLPLCGARAAATVSKKSESMLTLFSGVQGCLGCWHFFSFISLCIFVGVVISMCHVCEPVFAAGNETCDAEDRIAPDRVITLSADACSQQIPSLDQMITGIFLIVTTFVSCVASGLARKTGKKKIAYIVSVEPVTVPCFVPIPEDELAQP